MSIPKSSGAVLSSEIATPTVSGETCRRLDFCCLYRIIEECTALVTEPSQLVMVYEYHPSTPSGSNHFSRLMFQTPDIIKKTHTPHDLNNVNYHQVPDAPSGTSSGSGSAGVGNAGAPPSASPPHQSAAGWPCGGDIAAPPLGTIAPPPPPQPPAAAASAHHSIVGGGDATPAGVAGDTIGGGDTWLGLGLGLGVGMGLRSGLGLGLGLGVGLGLGLGAVPQTSAAPCSEGSLLSGGWLSPLLVSGIALWRSAVPEVSES